MCKTWQMEPWTHRRHFSATEQFFKNPEAWQLSLFVPPETAWRCPWAPAWRPGWVVATDTPSCTTSTSCTTQPRPAWGTCCGSSSTTPLCGDAVEPCVESGDSWRSSSSKCWKMEDTLPVCCSGGWKIWQQLLFFFLSFCHRFPLFIDRMWLQHLSLLFLFHLFSMRIWDSNRNHCVTQYVLPISTAKSTGLQTYGYFNCQGGRTLRVSVHSVVGWNDSEKQVVNSKRRISLKDFALLLTTLTFKFSFYVFSCLLLQCTWTGFLFLCLPGHC